MAEMMAHEDGRLRGYVVCPVVVGVSGGPTIGLNVECSVEVSAVKAVSDYENDNCDKKQGKHGEFLSGRRAPTITI